MLQVGLVVAPSEYRPVNSSDERLLLLNFPLSWRNIVGRKRRQQTAPESRGSYWFRQDGRELGLSGKPGFSTIVDFNEKIQLEQCQPEDDGQDEYWSDDEEDYNLEPDVIEHNHHVQQEAEGEEDVGEVEG